MFSAPEIAELSRTWSQMRMGGNQYFHVMNTQHAQKDVGCTRYTGEQHAHEANKPYFYVVKTPCKAGGGRLNPSKPMREPTSDIH